MSLVYFAPGRALSESYEIELHGYTCDCGLSHHPDARRARLRRLLDPDTSTGWVDGMESGEVRAIYPCVYGSAPAKSGKGQDPGYGVFRRDARAIGHRVQWEQHNVWSQR